MNIRSVLAAAAIVAVSAAAGAAPNPPISGCAPNRLPCGNGAAVCAALASQRNDMPDPNRRVIGLAMDQWAQSCHDLYIQPVLHNDAALAAGRKTLRTDR